MQLSVVLVDFNNPQHTEALLTLLDHYAKDPMGGGEPLSENCRENLIPELAKRADAVSVLLYEGDQAVALANCFESFSTFACQPLLNIHDVVVRDDHRGKGMAGKLMQAVKDIALQRGCVKLTLEVLQNNESAKRSYRKFGFDNYRLDPHAGPAEFWEKKL